ncbi:hemin transporter [Fusobacterium animalis]
MRAIGDQVAKNPEYLSVLDKKAIKNGKIDDKTQVEQVSVMNKLLNDALRAKGYKGPDIKMVLTDVTDPNGPYYTDTLTNVVVFDRKELAKSNRDQILNALGHEFGHYSKEDNKTGNQTIANYSGEKLEDRTKAIVSKEATEDTLAAIRNNKNVITGEEGKKLADSIPMDRREYYKVFIVKGSVSKVAAGVEVDGGVIYNKDPITGEEEFGYVLGGQGIIGIDYGKEDITNVGKILTRYDWDLASYEDKGKPIKEFQGFIGGAAIQVNLFGYQFNWGVSVGGNKADFGTDVNVTDGRIKVGGSGGYIHVIKLDNPSEAEKIFIRGLANNSEKIVDIKNIIFKIKDIIDGREELKKW